VNQKLQKDLLKLTEDKQISSIKTLLESLPSKEKGNVFEWYLAELFAGNGWLTKVQGGRHDLGADILLYHPKTPSKVSLIVQAKNQSAPLTFDDTKIELIKFEDKASKKHACLQFHIVAVNSFVGEAKKLQEFNLLLSDWSYVEKLIDGYDPGSNTYPAIELFAHNQNTYHRINDLWKDQNNVAVVQATGTGKSYLIARVMIDFLAEKKLVMAPSNYILEQQEGKVPWLSDSTIFMTYAKGANLSDSEVNQLGLQLIVLDEFHRCGAEIWGTGVQKILDTYPDAKVLGTTATPIRYLDNSRDMREELFNGIVAENLSLPEAIVRRILPPPSYISALYTLDEEIEELTDILHKSKKSDDEKKQIATEIMKANLDWEKTCGIPQILKKHLSSSINKIIIFCRNLDHLDLMELEVQKWFLKSKIHAYRKTYRVLSADPSSDQNLDDFKTAKEKNTIHLLFAIDMLNEGLHISDVGAVILLRPTESPIIFYQQIGRCIQVDADHTPIIFDFVNNFQNIRANDFIDDLSDAQKRENKKRKSFGLASIPVEVHVIDETKSILELFEKVKDRLQPWEVGFKFLEEYVLKHGHARVPASYKSEDEFKLGNWIRSRRTDKKNKKLPLDKIELLESVTGWIWDPFETAFQEGFAYLKQYVAKNGNARVPQRYRNKDEFNLGNWINSRRKDKKDRILSQDKIELLESFPSWTWDPIETAFQEGFDYLQQYVAENGNARVPASYKTEDKFNLGSWISSRRTGKKNKKLPLDKIELLESLPGWSWYPIETDFQEGFAYLKQYVAKNGNARVPQKYKTKDKFNLGRWISTRRVNKKNNILSQDKIELLESLTGWTWDPIETNFQEGIDCLQQYIAEYGHARVPHSYKTEDKFNLGNWISHRRRDKKNKKLPQDKIERLESLPGWTWDSLETDFQEGFVYLQQYVAECGHARVPHSYRTEDKFNLGTWISSRRGEKKNNNLPQDKIEQLDSLPGWTWDPIETAFQEGFAYLQQYVAECGHARVPHRYKTEDKFILGKWISNRRTDKKNNILSHNKIELLESLPGWTWDPIETAFQKGFAYLQQYVAEYGHARVPQIHKTEDDFTLGTWISSRRTDKKDNKLPQDKIELLESLPGWTWDPRLTGFQEGFVYLQQYVEEHGHARVPVNYKTESKFNLGTWISHRRKEQKNKKLPHDKIELLESLPGWTWECR
jgi:superfamily II DNA or RNA helicase